jgi:MFS family permease
LLYSIVQGGWPLGVFLASGVYLAFGRLGWRFVFLLGVLPIVVVIAGRFFVREPERFERLQGLRSEATLRTLFAQPGPIRKQLALLSVTWIFYGASCVATNFYIAYWLTKYKGFTDSSVSTLLLVCGGIGFFFYILGGWLGERFGRREVMIVTGAMVAPLTILLLLAQQRWIVVLVYFLLYQATNGTWSGAGYAYQAESFPTAVRGTAVGFLGAVQVGGFILGSILWAALSTFAKPWLLWLIVATAMSFGMWTTVFLRRIPPGHDLDAVISEIKVG